PRRLLGRRTARPVRSQPPGDDHRRADALAGDGDRRLRGLRPHRRGSPRRVWPSVGTWAPVHTFSYLWGTPAHFTAGPPPPGGTHPWGTPPASSSRCPTWRPSGS